MPASLIPPYLSATEPFMPVIAEEMADTDFEKTAALGYRVFFDPTSNIAISRSLQGIKLMTMQADCCLPVLYASAYGRWVAGATGVPNKTASIAAFDAFIAAVNGPIGGTRQLKYVVDAANFNGDTSAVGASFVLSVPGNHPLDFAVQINKALGRRVVFWDGTRFVFGYDPDSTPFYFTVREYASNASGAFVDISTGGSWGFRVVGGMPEDGIVVDPATMNGSWSPNTPTSNIWIG